MKVITLALAFTMFVLPPSVGRAQQPDAFNYYTTQPVLSQPEQPDAGDVDFAKLHADGAIRVHVLACGGVRIEDRTGVIYQHPSHCQKRRDDD